MPNGTVQKVGIHNLALDEIVLGAGPKRLFGDTVVIEPGQ